MDVVKVIFILLKIIVNGFCDIDLFLLSKSGFVYGMMVVIIVIDNM